LYYKRNHIIQIPKTSPLPTIERMGNTSSIEFKDNSGRFTTVGKDSSGNPIQYPIKHVKSFNELPEIVKQNIISTIKSEIKEWYEKNPNTYNGFTYVTKKVREQFIYDGYYQYMTNSSGLDMDLIYKEIGQFCDELFTYSNSDGVRVKRPYILTGDYHILFVRNVTV
jgi:hypothetical protein